MSTSSDGTGQSRTMKASEFKAKCLGLMNEVAENGGEIGIRANNLPDFHVDPADCIIDATAMNGHELVTADRRILDWSGRLRCVDAAR